MRAVQGRHWNEIKNTQNHIKPNKHREKTNQLNIADVAESQNKPNNQSHYKIRQGPGQGD